MNAQRPSIVDLRKPVPQERFEPAEQTHAPVSSSAAQKTREETGEFILSWETPEFQKYEKDRSSWTRNIIMLFGAIGLIFLLMKNFLGIVLAFFGALALIVNAFKEPRILLMAISGRGIHMGNRLYPFESLESFWVFYSPPEVKEVSIRSKKMFATIIKMPLGDMDPVEVRNELVKFIPEEEQRESVFDAISRKIGY